MRYDDSKATEEHSLGHGATPLRAASLYNNEKSNHKAARPQHSAPLTSKREHPSRKPPFIEVPGILSGSCSSCGLPLPGTSQERIDLLCVDCRSWGQSRLAVRAAREAAKHRRRTRS